MKIITVPNPILKQISTPVTTFDKKLKKFVTDLESTLKNKKNPEGVGLSAPQVAKNLRVFATYLGDPRQLNTFINPEIIDHSDDLTLGGPPEKPFLEGCLSIPDIYGPVHRYPWITLRFLRFTSDSPEPVEITQTFHDFPARVVQHEYDHLEGILFTSHTIKSSLPLYKEIDGQLHEIDPSSL